MITIKYFILYVVFVVCFSLVHCEYAMTTNEEVESTKELGRELVEQGNKKKIQSEIPTIVKYKI